jgi:hypothetical protein
MPCDSSYMDPTTKEVQLSQVACLLDELEGKPIDRRQWNGFHPLVYGQSVDCDGLVRRLCAKLQSVDVTKFSLEMQIWWRNHQAADKARIERELALKQNEKDREAILAKLTPRERSLLGF